MRGTIFLRLLLSGLLCWGVSAKAGDYASNFEMAQEQIKVKTNVEMRVLGSCVLGLLGSVAVIAVIPQMVFGGPPVDPSVVGGLVAWNLGIYSYLQLEKLELALRFRGVLKKKRKAIESLLHQLPRSIGSLCYGSLFGAQIAKEVRREPLWRKGIRLGIPLLLHLPIFLKPKDPICALREAKTQDPFEFRNLFGDFLRTDEGTQWFEEFQGAVEDYSQAYDDALSIDSRGTIRQLVSPGPQTANDSEEILDLLETLQ